MKELRLQSSEWVLIFFGALLFGSAFYLYASNFPIQEYLFKINFNIQEPTVGILQLQNGRIKRKSAQQNEFQNIKIQTPLYNLDTLVTDNDSSATVLLDDGSTIELSPSTMIQLVFEKSFAIDGISRSATINVVAGNVSGSSKKDRLILKSKTETVQLTSDLPTKTIAVDAPIIKPIALPPIAMVNPVPDYTPEAPIIPKIVGNVSIISPRIDSSIAIPDYSLRPVALLPVRLFVKPAQARVKVKVSRVGSQGRSQVTFEGETERGFEERSVDVSLLRPGSYRIQAWIPEEDGYQEVTKESQVTLSDTFKGIKVDDPLIAGESFKTNEYSGKLLKDFDVTFRWDKYPNIKEYIFKFYRSDNTSKPLLERKVQTPQLTLNKNKVFSGNVLYSITANVSNGFKVTSGLNPFRFDFLPPQLVEPKNASVLNFSDAKVSNPDSQRILFTWQKTNFTEEYEIEFSQTPFFQKKVLTNRLKENFLLLKMPSKGKYYWRVKSHATGTTSPPSPPNEFTVK